MGHFVKFFGADVGAVGEAEIDLSGPREPSVRPLYNTQVFLELLPSVFPLPNNLIKNPTYQRKPPPHILICKHSPLMILQFKFSPHLRPTDTFRRFRYSFALHARFFVPEVEYHACAGCKEDDGGTEGERLLQDQWVSICVLVGGLNEAGRVRDWLAHPRGDARALFFNGFVETGDAVTEQTS